MLGVAVQVYRNQNFPLALVDHQNVVRDLTQKIIPDEREYLRTALAGIQLLAYSL